MREVEILQHIAELAEISEYKAEILQYVNKKMKYIKDNRHYFIEKRNKKAEKFFNDIFPYIEENQWKNAEMLYNEYLEDFSENERVYSPNEFAKLLGLLVYYKILEKRNKKTPEKGMIVYEYKLRE